MQTFQTLIDQSARIINKNMGILNEELDYVEFDNSIKAPIKNKIKKLIYKVLDKNKTTKKDCP